MTTTLTRMPTSGQARVNAKRNARAEYWRTVEVPCSVEIEPHFREHLHLLGRNARVLGRRPLLNGFEVLLDVHIPGAPADAVRALPVYSSDWDGERAHVRLLSIEWFGRNGKRVEAEQTAGAA